MDGSKRVLVLLVGAVLSATAVVISLALGWRVALVVGIFAAASWGLALVDRPREALPEALQWLLPARGKWARMLLIGTALWILLAFPFWVSWILG